MPAKYSREAAPAPLRVRRRVLIAGSGLAAGAPGGLQAAHSVVRALVPRLVEAGATFVVPIDSEPVQEGSALPTLFDWSVLESAWAARDRRPHDPGPGPFIVAVTHAKGLRKVPEARAELWSEVRAAPETTVISLGEVNSGALRRAEQARHADVLIAMGGGEGVRHLAELMHSRARPVIPLNAELGRPDDGAEYLARLATSRADQFFEVAAGSSQGLLDSLDTRVLVDPDSLAQAILDCLARLRPPTAFAVRLLADNHSDFADVDEHFTGVVAPVAAAAGYELLTAGRLHEPRGFLNTEVMALLDESEIVITDLTGERPNCYLELGYALGSGKAVLATARQGTTLPFDLKAFPVWFWSETAPLDKRREGFGSFWGQQVHRAPLFARRTLE